MIYFICDTYILDCMNPEKEHDKIIIQKNIAVVTDWLSKKSKCSFLMYFNFEMCIKLKL